MARVRASKSSHQQKALGKEVAGFNASVWDQLKYDVVIRANELKFAQCYTRRNEHFVYHQGDKDPTPVSLKELLLATGWRELAEASRTGRVCGGFGSRPSGRCVRRGMSGGRIYWGTF